MIHWKHWLGSALAALALAGAGNASAAQQTLRVQTAVPNSSMYFELMQRWASASRKCRATA